MFRSAIRIARPAARRFASNSALSKAAPRFAAGLALAGVVAAASVCEVKTSFLSSNLAFCLEDGENESSSLAYLVMMPPLPTPKGPQTTKIPKISPTPPCKNRLQRSQHPNLPPPSAPLSWWHRAQNWHHLSHNGRRFPLPRFRSPSQIRLRQSLRRRSVRRSRRREGSGGSSFVVKQRRFQKS